MLKDLQKISDARYAAILFAASFLAVLPMIVFGIFEGIDLPQHLQFASTFYQAIASGDFYPGWAANENLGYGSLGVRFYPPLSSFTIALMRVLTGDWYSAVWTTYLIFSFVGGLGVYLWAKEFIASSKAVWAGVIFIFSPYHLFEILNTSLYAEFVGASVLPFCFLFVNRICRRGKTEDIIGLAVSYAILIFAHLPLTVIGSLSLFVYALAQISKHRNRFSFLKLASAVILGLASSSIYWLKVVTEKQWLRNTAFAPDVKHFDYNLHFLLIPPRTEADMLWFFNLIVITIIVFVIGAKVGLARKENFELNHSLRALFILFVFSILMLTPLSQPMWAVVPFLSEVQFPWRWIVVPSIAGSILIAANFSFWSFSNQTFFVPNSLRRIIAVAAVLCVVLIYGSIYYKFSFNIFDSASFNELVEKKSKSMGFEWFWTIKTKVEVFKKPEKIIADNRKVEILSWQSTERYFTVEQGNEVRARVATLFYPHWKAAVNDVPVDLILADDGAINIPIPAEKSNVKIWFQEPFHINLAFYISATTWLILGFAGLFVFWKDKKFYLFALGQAAPTAGQNQT